MAKAKFGLNDILNAKSRAAAAGRVEDYEEIYLSPYEVKAAPENTHQSLENIEELADSFLHVGQEQPTVLARVNGEFRIVDGHRRNAANIMNLERGHKEYERVKYRYKDMTEAMYELSLLAGNGYTQPLTAYEKTRLVERTKSALIRAKEEDGLEIKGKMRDLVAAMLNESSTNIARMGSINKNATPEIKEQLKNGNMGITAAYETPHPESITSLCYSCQRYKDCNVKTGTCEKCDQYINKAEAEKTDEQRYNEEQDRIDRETKKKLQEKADTEKMEHLPSDTKAKKYIRVSKQTFKGVCAGVLPYLLLKYEKYSAGEIAVIQEFEEGRATGNTKEIYISCVDTEETHTAIAEGYCVLGICEKEIAVEKGWLSEVSETDTEGQISRQMSIDDYKTE